jgi:DNA polymerase III delta prime subunit
MNNKKGIPFVELYRPKRFDDVVLDPINKLILTNVIETEYFPNLLFYGPPGTGKTTTIINLIQLYQEKKNQKNSELIIHLNASDERGIEVIRSQIHQFVYSKTLFVTGMKFVILDEVDSMTKIAQQALKCLLQNYPDSVRFCLIGNYISRIDDGLQCEFLKLRFNCLPEKDIIDFLKHICVSEQLHFSDETLRSIQTLYGSDIRSMINFMQSNQHVQEQIRVIEDFMWRELLDEIQSDAKIAQLYQKVCQISCEYNVDLKHVMKDFFHYIIRQVPALMTPKWLNCMENIVHSEGCNEMYYVKYSLVQLKNQ